MHADRTATAERPLTARSAVANGSRLFVEGLDGRSALARRYRDLVAQFVADVGGDPSEAQQQIIRRAASLSVWCEAIEVKLASGEDIDIAPYVTATNSVRRLLVDIGLQRTARDVTPSLSTYIEQNYGPAATAAARAASESVAPGGWQDYPASTAFPAPPAAVDEAVEGEPDEVVAAGGRAVLHRLVALPGGQDRWGIWSARDPSRGCLGAWPSLAEARTRAEALREAGKL